MASDSAGRPGRLFCVCWIVVLALLAGSGWACVGRFARSARAGRRAAGIDCAEGAGLAVVALPLPQGWRRDRLTREYVRERYDPQAASLRFAPRMIVLHWTELPDLSALWKAFRPARIPASRPELLHAGRVNVASQFVIDRDGAIYRLLPETAIARHTIGLNRVAIGIENVGGSDAPLTECQVRANVKLVADLAARYPTIRYLIGHHEYGRFRGTPLWEERDPTYFTNKIDPGDEFMAAVRERIAPLRLASEYAPGTP